MFCSAPVFLKINTMSRLDFLTSTLRSLGYWMQITNHQRALTHLQSFSSRPSPAAGCLDRRELRFPGGGRAVVFGKMAVCAPHSSWVSQLALLKKVQHCDSLVKRNRWSVYIHPGEKGALVQRGIDSISHYRFFFVVIKKVSKSFHVSWKQYR